MKKILTVILDGFGWSDNTLGNAVKMAPPDNFLELWKKYPHSLLEASEEAVGLEPGQFGNSEVGHMTIGAGRKILQSIALIREFLNGDVELNANFLDMLDYLHDTDKPLHIIGLLSDGKVHSSFEHFLQLIDILYKEKNHTYSSCVTAYIYDLLSFEKTYNELDDHLKEIYKPLLKIAEDKAYDEIINHLKVEDGIEIAINLQNILGYSLDNSKLIKAKDRFYKSLGYNPTKQKRFLSRLVSNEPYTKDMNKKIIEVLEKDIETV